MTDEQVAATLGLTPDGQVFQPCTVCGVGQIIFRKKIWIGDNGFCDVCFEGWYEGGITNADRLAAYAVERRAERQARAAKREAAG